MKKGLEIIKETEYVTYFYENIYEYKSHRKEMMAKGWFLDRDCLINLQEDEVCYWRNKDIKYEISKDR